MTKKKSKHLKRFGALLALVFVFAFALAPISASALSNNSLNFSFLPDANLINTPSAINPYYERPFVLSSSDAFNGKFTFTSTAVSTTAQSAVISVPFKDLAPYVSVGDVVYLSWDVDNSSSYTHMLQFLNNSTYGDFYTKGEPLTVTQEILDSHLVFYPFAKIETVGETCTYSSFRCNYDGVKDFAPYTQTENYVAYLNGVYQQGHSEGVVEEANRVNAYLPVFSKSNLGSAVVYYGKNNGALSDRYIVTEAVANEFDSNGYSYSSDSFPNSVLTPPLDYDFIDTVIMSFQCLYSTGDNYSEWLKASNLSVTISVAPKDRVSFTVVTMSGVEYTKTYLNNTERSQNRTFTNADFGLQDTETIRFIELGYINYAKAEYPSFVVTTATPDYATGYEYGYNVGFSNGFVDGKAYNDPLVYEQGKEEGISIGYDSGLKDGEIIGYNKGYYDGADDEGWFNLFSAAVSAPVNMLTQMLDFHIMGVNMHQFFTSIITVCCLVAIIRFII